MHTSTQRYIFQKSAAKCISILTLVGVIACASPNKTQLNGENQAPTVFGPEETSPVGESEIGPPLEIKNPIVLVLGPGMAKSFAHVGVLKALKEAHIPIGAIIGTEMGALIGLAYSKSKTIHEFEWTLRQIKDECFIKNKGRRDGCLKSSLEKAFGDHEIKALNIPTRLALEVPETRQFVFLDRGSISEAIRAGFGFREYWPPVEVDSRILASSVESRPYPVDDAKLMNIGPVVVVHVLAGRHLKQSTDPDAASLEIEFGPMFTLVKKRSQPELNRADFIIEVDLSDMGLFEFKKRTTAAFKGKAAALKNMQLIRALIGNS